MERDPHLSKAHDALALLLTYPWPEFREHAGALARTVVEAVPEAEEDLQGFLHHVRDQPRVELEELFTRTFDNNAKLALEVGWHVYGETYDRGAFLVQMRNSLREVGVRENGELPDHLSHVLAVLGRVDRAEAESLGALAVRAISTVAAELAAADNPYRGVLDAAWKLVATYTPAEVTQ